MDLATLIGMIVGIVCLIWSIMIGGRIWSFVHLPSIIIVLGGGLCATLISCKITEFAKIMKVVVKVLAGKESRPQDTIKMLVELSLKARREGLLSLESEQENIDNDFLKQSLQLVVDGVEPEVIVDTMDLELENMKARHDKGAGLFKTMASQFPAWGMIGTLIGLIQLLEALDDPSAIGSAMAIALVTTFYGSVLANLICNPIASKLSQKSKEEIQEKKMIIEGVLSIQAGENPRILEHKLKTFLSPKQKLEYDQMTNQASEERRSERNEKGREAAV
ncbi:motility protein A [Acetivibrio mesophilus]|uniref:Motility protein A n=1 Tax=Acetivibrio mesophilus TaxID=2487273 RepID=A0A4Q0I3F0_9FIRM|nr:motility protein A [Acetivibrio mesophilus]ODM27209.1 flagellar motor protein MotP [Clostridium sp. Bc-iso-3]RXE58756.1 motility protein A [Acetivibrio mesophilus]